MSFSRHCVAHRVIAPPGGRERTESIEAECSAGHTYDDRSWHHATGLSALLRFDRGCRRRPRRAATLGHGRKRARHLYGLSLHRGGARAFRPVGRYGVLGARRLGRCASGHTGEFEKTRFTRARRRAASRRLGLRCLGIRSSSVGLLGRQSEWVRSRRTPASRSARAGTL